MTPFVRDNLAPTLSGKKILLGITGSIAAFKACDIVRFLRDCGAEVRVVLTEAAEKFVTPLTLETLSGSPVGRELFPEQAGGTHHITASRWADLILVAPASANTIAKITHGFANDLLSSEILAADCPVLLAPAMNPMMYSNPATRANLATLETRGVRLVGPAHGETSCGEEGPGRMLEPREIVIAVARAFAAPENGKHLLITLGPTRSRLDPVRFLSNRSSGLMGVSLCWAALQKGYRVTAVSGPIQAELPPEIDIVPVETAREMEKATLSHWGGANMLIATAAVLDWDVKNRSAQKLKKGQAPESIELVENPDILAAACAQMRPDQFALGFAAETEQVLEHGREKLSKKGCDAVFVNDVSSPEGGFESLRNSGWLITASETHQITPRSKPELARDILEWVEQQYARKLQSQTGQSLRSEANALLD